MALVQMRSKNSNAVDAVDREPFLKLEAWEYKITLGCGCCLSDEDKNITAFYPCDKHKKMLNQ